jgi:hypothetical protein
MIKLSEPWRRTVKEINLQGDGLLNISFYYYMIKGLRILIGNICRWEYSTGIYKKDLQILKRYESLLFYKMPD